MPKNSPIKANTIDEAKLPPHLRKRNKGWSVTMLQAPSATTEKYLTATSIIIGNLLYLDVDGYLKLASNDGHSAEFIALSAGEANQLIEVNSEGIIDYTLNYSNNTILFLGINGNYTDTPPSTTNSVFQRVGIYNNNKIKYNIDDYYLLE
jgi:hypothetical protein